MAVVFRRTAAKCISSINHGNFYYSTEQCLETAGNIIKSPYPDIEIPNVPLADLIFQNFNKWPSKTAIECSVTNRKYTFDEIRLKSRNLAKSFKQKLKLQKGDVLAILLPNIPEFPIVLYGGFQAGTTVTTINPNYTVDEISKQLLDADAKAIVTVNTSFESAEKAVKKAKKDIPIVIVKTTQSEALARGAVNFSELVENSYDRDDLPYINPDDVVAMPYSSGTTGLPKGVELMNKNLVANLCQGSLPEVWLHQMTTDTHQDVIPAMLPNFHIYGLFFYNVYSIHHGVKLVTLPRFKPELFLSVLKNYKPTMLFLVPPLVNFINTSPLVQKQHLESVRLVSCGAAPMGPLEEIKLSEKAEKSIDVLQGYGLTECSPMVATLTAKTKQELNAQGSIGQPFSNTCVKIISTEDNKSLKAFEAGELLVKGPQVMRGYHNRPEATAETIVDGWLRTGDVAYYDDNGLLYITDRLKELIKVKGFQVAPAELEELIRNYPEVEEAAVIGIPHDQYGEVPRAYVVPKKDKKLNTDNLNKYLETRVSNYKLLRGGVAVIDKIPKTASGKVLRRVLKQLYEKEKL